jgi:hypothetical protein
MLFNIRTKFWIYEKTNRLVCTFFKRDKEAINYVLKPKHLRFKSETRQENLDEKNPYTEIALSKHEQEQQESAAFITVTFLSLFFSFLLNFVYSVFLQEIMVSTTVIANSPSRPIQSNGSSDFVTPSTSKSTLRGISTWHCLKQDSKMS